MTREEFIPLADPLDFKPFVIVTGGGRFRVHHPDFVKVPPAPDPPEDGWGDKELPPDPSYIIVFNRRGAPRLISLSNIQQIEFDSEHSKVG